MKLSLIKKMALLLVGLATVQGYAQFYYDPKGRSVDDIYSENSNSCGYEIGIYGCFTPLGEDFIRYTEMVQPVLYAGTISSISYDEKRKILSFVDTKKFVKPVKRLYGLAVFGATDESNFYKQENHVQVLWLPVDPNGERFVQASKQTQSIKAANLPYVLNYGYMDGGDVTKCYQGKSLSCQMKSTLLSDRYVFIKETAGGETVELDLTRILEDVSGSGYPDVVVAFRRIEYQDPLTEEYEIYPEEVAAKTTTNLDIVTYQYNVKIPVPQIYTITFLGYDGKPMNSKVVFAGDVPEAPSLTVKEDSEEFRYFAKWTPEIVPVTEDATYKAVLDSVKKDFNVYLAADYEAGGDISLSVENKTSCVSVTKKSLDGFSYSSNSAVKLSGGAHTLLFDVTLNTNGDCANDELAKTIKWTCADESELHFDGCTAIPVYVNGVKNERMLLSEHNDGVYNNGFEYEFDVEVADEKLPTIQLAATYAVGGDVELVSTNAASCVTITKRYLNANCDSYDEDGLCLASEMLYKYSKGSWMLDQGPQDWPIGTGDVNLKVDKSYQLEYGLNFKPANCTEKEFVDRLALVSVKSNIPVYINGSLIGTVLTYSPYFNFTLGSLPQYSITFLDFDGKKISSKLAAAGEIPEAPSLSVKEDTEKYHYFVKWSPMIVPATEDVSYKAVLDSTKILSIQLAATYAVGGDVELVSTNAASCVSVKKNILWANCNSFDESGNCKIGEMIYSYSTGSWLPMAGPQDWVSGSVDVDLKVGKSYQLSYTLVRDFSKCTEAEFVNALTLVTEQDEIPVYINGSKVGTVLTYSPYFNFTLKSQYTITFFDDKGVQVGDVVTVASGMAVSAPAEPAKREGYTFAGWFQKDAESAYDFSAAVNEDLELYGKWTVNKYEIAVAANDSKMGSVKGAGTYEYGTEVELVATAAEGYKFSNWEDDVKASATRKVKVTAAASYKANFEKIAESSSSEAATNSSSSRNDTESSSSSAKDDKSSSSSKTEAIVATAVVPQFSLSVAGRNLQIAGARIGSAYAILDMQGRVMTTGSVESANFSVALPRSGSYMVRVGSQTQRVNVK